MSGDKPTVYLVDGSGYIYRAYHAVRHLSTREGLPTNATFGFANMVLKLLSEKSLEYAAIAFDAKGPTFRHDIYEAYKANRPPMPEDLAMQIPHIKQIVAGLNIPSLELSGYEADDIIGTIAVQAERAGFRVVMVTGDKDFRQLISPNVEIWDPMREKTMTYPGFKDMYGLEPAQWVDVLALAGDSSDNIPGVPGIGEKTAVTLLQTYKSVNGLYAGLEGVEKKKKLHENLVRFKEQAFLSRRLVSICKTAPVPEPVDVFRVAPPDRGELAALFKKLEFRRLHERFAEKKDLRDKDYGVITDEVGLDAVIRELKKSQLFAIDLETTSIDPMLATIVGLSFSWKPHQAVYIPIRHQVSKKTSQLDPAHTLALLKPLLEDPKASKVGQNIKYDWIVLKRAGIHLQGVTFDTMVASYLLEPNRRAHNLESIASEYLNHKMITYEEVTGDKKGKKGFEEVPIDKAYLYACEDADITLLAYHVFKDALEEQGFPRLFNEVEMPLISVLVDMELTGVAVDKDRLAAISKDFGHQLDQIEEQIYRLAGERFNIQSHQQMGHILFEKLKLPIQKKTKKTKGYSTDVEVLSTLALEHELPGLVLTFRSMAKLKSTYTDALIELIHPETKRIHTSYNQTVAATGRLSSSNPNLQNIPIKTEEGRQIRAAFVPRPGSVLLSSDYSQIELRLLAHYSEDPILLEAFEKGEDIHARTATEVFELFPSMISAEMRRQAKVINFGIIYGMGPFSLAKELGISQKMARTYIDHYFARYAGVKTFIEKTIEKARDTGYVETLMGRVRRLPDIASKNHNVRKFAERTAVNTPLQGTAADLIKIAMVRIHDEWKRQDLASKMILQVHDELVFEVPEEEQKRVTELAKSIMEDVYPLKVPLKVNISTGPNWAEAH